MKKSAKRNNSWALVGIPDHQGVMNVGGRIGAAEGPKALRKVFARFKGTEGVLESCKDFGDVIDITSDVSINHRHASDLVRTAHEEKGISVVVGGGHDHGFSHLRGISEALPKKRIGCINIDAHFDLRRSEPIITSGSPFYLAIESGLLKPARFVEFGIQSHCNGPELWQYARAKKLNIIPFERLRHGKAARAFAAALSKLSKSCDAVVVSLDLDAAAAAFAPGVSAPQAEGFTPSDIIEMMEIAGSAKSVVSLGIFELNPLLDQDDRTARLGATAAYHFIARALAR